MTEYIRKQAVLNLIDEFQYNHETNTWGVTKDGVVVLKPDTLDKLHEAVKAMPAADVVEVVRCKDCKDFRPWGGQSKLGDCMVCVCDGENPFTMEETDFCSDGDRKDDQQCK